MTKTTVTVPANGGPVEAVSTIETVPYWTRSRRRTGKIYFMMANISLGAFSYKTNGSQLIIHYPLNSHPSNLVETEVKN